MNALPDLERHPGFTLIRISGNPYERGLQHGRLLGEQIRSLREVFYRDVVNLHGRPFGIAMRAVMLPILLSLQRHIPPELRLEMRGVAHGAGVPYWDILTFNCFDDMLHALWLIPQWLQKVPYIGARLSCSSFALTAARTRDGRLLHGRNLDYEVASGILAGDGAVTRALKEHVVAIEIRPDRGQAYLSVGRPGVVWVVTSINTAGLSLACLTSTLSGETPNGVPLPILYRLISQYSTTLDDAERLIRRARITIGNNLLVASAAEDDARVFELSPRYVAARRPRDGVIVTTNHFEHEEMVPRQGGWVVQNSLDRCARLSTLCADGTAGPERAAQFLRDTQSLGEDGSEWSCLENPGTIYSSLAEPASGRIWLRVNDQPEREFIELAASWATARLAVPA
jgi:hypothetical protein